MADSDGTLHLLLSKFGRVCDRDNLLVIVSEKESYVMFAMWTCECNPGVIKWSCWRGDGDEI